MNTTVKSIEFAIEGVGYLVLFAKDGKTGKDIHDEHFKGACDDCEVYRDFVIAPIQSLAGFVLTF